MLPHLTLEPSLGALDPNIRSLVQATNSLGIKTYWSCEGHESASMIQSPVPCVVMDYRSSNKKGFGTLILSVGSLNEEHLGELDWQFLPRYRVGNGSPFLALSPRYYSSQLPTILAQRQREAQQLAEIIIEMKLRS